MSVPTTASAGESAVLGSVTSASVPVPGCSVKGLRRSC